MTEFAIGQRVNVSGEHDGEKFVDEPGAVASSPDWMGNHVCIRFDRERERFHDGHEGDDNHHWFFDRHYPDYSISPVVGPSTYLNGIDALSDLANKPVDVTPALTLGSHSEKPKEGNQMQERYLTAYKDGPDFRLTGDDAFSSQRDADNHANSIAATEADVCVVVLKIVSSHSSRIVVTSEAA